MNNLNLFYKYYDVLFESKNYAEEVASVLKIAAEAWPYPVEKVLEIGCGTGSHTLELAKRVNEVTALDTDKTMIHLAQSKIKGKRAKNIEFFHGPIEQLTQKPDFDLTLALFNVVTYIPNEQAIASFLQSVRRHLKKGGGFIFDCWNGTAAIKNPPVHKRIEKAIGSQRIVCNLTPQTDFKKKITTLTYSLVVFEQANGKTNSDEFIFDQKLWTPLELQNQLKKADFKLLNICQPFQPQAKATDDDWKIMFVCEAA